MKNKNIKNLIMFSAIAFTIFGFSIHSAQAYVPGVWDPMPRVDPNGPAFYVVPNTNDTGPTTTMATYNNSAFVTPSQNTQTTNAPAQTSNNTTVKKVAATSSSSSTIRKSSSTQVSDNSYNITTPANARSLPQVVSGDNGITALSLAGSGGFMPSSVWQWLLVVLLILVIVIISRMLARTSQEMHKVATH